MSRLWFKFRVCRLLWRELAHQFRIGYGRMTVAYELLKMVEWELRNAERKVKGE